MDFTNEISILMKERQRLIAINDYEQARIVEESIDQLKSSSKGSDGEDKKKYNQRQFEQQLENVKLEAVQLVSQGVQDLIFTRCYYQRLFTDLQQRHADQLTELTVAFAKDIDLVAGKGIPKVNTLEKDAKNQAQMSNYEFAKRILSEAHKVRGEVFYSRQNTIQQSYIDRQDAMIKKHNEECKLVEEKQDNDLRGVYIIFNRNIEGLKRKIETMCIHYDVHLNPAQIDRILEEYKLTDDQVTAEPSPRKVRGLISPRLQPQRKEDSNAKSSNPQKRTPRSFKKTSTSDKHTPTSSNITPSKSKTTPRGKNSTD